MSVSELEIIQTEYKAGRVAFERGRYRQSLDHFETARDLVEKDSSLGGEVQIWLATAYEAVGQRQKAIALCKFLIRHPSWEARKQSRRLLEILQAPELSQELDGLIQFPDLSNLDDNQVKVRQTTTSKSVQRASRSADPPEPVDLTQVKTQDNGFFWVVLVGLIAVVGSLFFLS